MVTDDPREAARLVERGECVVLIADPSATPALPAGPGRLALFAGSPDEAASWTAAQAMAEELFGSR
jgi:hypothetical protein